MLLKSLSALEIVYQVGSINQSGHTTGVPSFIVALLGNLNGSSGVDCADIFVASVDDTSFTSHSHGTSCGDRGCKYNTDYFHLSLSKWRRQRGSNPRPGG